jgi:protoporphyrin/coproporphyrin ferrochelatase
MTERVGGERVGVLVMAYGTPRRLDDVEAYYTEIRRGRPPSAEQLAELVRRYEAIGGLSPLAERTEAQRAGIEAALEERAAGRFDVLLGFKHAAPTIEDGIAALACRGVGRVVGLVLAPHYSALSVGEYLARADTAAGRLGLEHVSIRHWHLEPAYLDFLTRAVQAGLSELGPAPVIFTAHSLPARILADGDPYAEEVRATATAVAARAELDAGWQVAWQSASPTPEPWLQPDLLQVISELGQDAVLVCPCGFVSDHLEVLFDLDVRAREHAADLGTTFARTPSINADPAVLGALADLVISASAA